MRAFARLISILAGLGVCGFCQSNEYAFARSATIHQSVYLNFLKITADLAAESHVLDKEVRPLMLEARMQVVESGAVSQPLQARLRDVEDQWARTVQDHVEQLRIAFGERRFRTLDEFIQAGRSMYQKPAQR